VHRELRIADCGIRNKNLKNFPFIDSAFSIPKSEFEKEAIMPRREKDRELARRRKRRKERRKLRAKGLLGSPVGTVKESEKKKSEKAPVKEPPQEGLEKTPSGD
jgi:hypothetical protein